MSESRTRKTGQRACCSSSSFRRYAGSPARANVQDALCLDIDRVCAPTTMEIGDPRLRRLELLMAVVAQQRRPHHRRRPRSIHASTRTASRGDRRSFPAASGAELRRTATAHARSRTGALGTSVSAWQWFQPQHRLPLQQHRRYSQELRQL